MERTIDGVDSSGRFEIPSRNWPKDAPPQVPEMPDGAFTNFRFSTAPTAVAFFSKIFQFFLGDFAPLAVWHIGDADGRPPGLIAPKGVRGPAGSVGELLKRGVATV